MRTESLILENLIYNGHYSSVIGIFLKPEYFKDNIEKIIFTEIQKHISEYNKPPTVESLSVKLSNRNDLNETTFQSCEELLKTYKKKIDDEEWLIKESEKWAKDQAVYNGIVSSISILEGKEKNISKDAIPEILTEALAISLDQSVGHNYIENGDDRWDFYHKKEYKIPFDMVMLDKITNGGISPKTLTVLLGGTGVGKTLVKTHFACQYMKQGLDVLYITMEMAEERIAERIDANLLNIRLDDLVSLPKKMYEKKIEDLKSTVKGRLIIKEYPTAAASTNHFRALLNELNLKRNFKPDMILVDYINICSSARIRPGQYVNSYSYIKSIAEELRGLAVEFDVPILSATQTNRQGFQNTDVGLEDTSESFGLPATADFMFALISNENLEEAGQMLIKQLKNRYSDITSNKKFLVGVDRAKMRLSDLGELSQSGLVDTGKEEKQETPVFDTSSKKAKKDFGEFKFGE